MVPPGPFALLALSIHASAACSGFRSQRACPEQASIAGASNRERLTIARRFQRRVAVQAMTARAGGTFEASARRHVVRWFRRPYGTRVVFGLRDPASELAGYFRWSLRDLLLRFARSFDSHSTICHGRRSRRACPEQASIAGASNRERLTIARRFQRRVAAQAMTARAGVTFETSARRHLVRWFRRPSGTRLAFGSRGPASELAGYFRWSLRDLLLRFARSFDSHSTICHGRRSRRACPEQASIAGASNRERLTIARRFQRRVTAPNKSHRVPEGRLNLRHYPQTNRGSYSTLCFFKNATNSSSKLRLR